MSTTQKASRQQRLTGWGLGFLYGLLKFNWFTIWAIISTIAVFGSFILITVQALWWNFADVLLPMKIAIPTGYGAVLLHMTRQVIRYSRSKEPESALVAAIEVMMFGGSIYALQGAITSFYGRGVYIGLGEAILPFEVRVVATVALILPVVFLLAAGFAFALAALLKGALESFVAEFVAKPNAPANPQARDKPS